MTDEPTPPRDFAGARERLDEILAELEQDAGDVDQLAARIKEASSLIRFCRERLSAARHDVQQVVAELSAEDQAEPAPVEDDVPVPDEGGKLDPGGELPF